MRSVAPHEALDDLVKPYTIVTSSDGQKSDAMTAVWVSQVSFNPPMVMVSIGNNRLTRKIIDDSCEFAVNTLKEKQKQIADYCGRVSRKEEDKIFERGIPVETAGSLKAPLLKESPSSLECKVVSRQDCGDHTVYIGGVIAAHKGDGEPVGLLRNRVVMPPEK